MIPFNKAPVTGFEVKYIEDAIQSKKLAGDGKYTNLCHDWLESTLKCNKALLTPSCTHALEMAAILCDIQPGDEVIMPSYTFVSSANAFVLRGATIVFVDVDKETLNINPKLVASAVTDKTKAIVPVHYAGVSCDMGAIMAIAQKNNLYVIEDAAQALMSKYKGRYLGTIGHIGTFSFHETKNITSGGEGGAIIVNDPALMERAEIIREKGTNRTNFFRGTVDKYSWVDIGSSYLPSEIQAAYLYSQFEHINDITSFRVGVWNSYSDLLLKLEEKGHIELPTIPMDNDFNAHIFYIRVQDIETRSSLIKFLKEKGVMAVFHYIPLHTSIAGEQFSRFFEEDVYTTIESERLIRLPLWYGLTQKEITLVANCVVEYFETK